MFRTSRSITVGLSVALGLCAALGAQDSPKPEARTIELHLAPEPDAPIIGQLIASQRVILDAAPAPRNAAAGWRQLPLPTPFEGFVPAESVDKSLSIAEGSPVRYLPTMESARITRVEAGDQYEVVRRTDQWVTVRFRKAITGYFNTPDTESFALDLGAARPLQPQSSPRRETAREAESVGQGIIPPRPLAPPSSPAQPPAGPRAELRAEPQAEPLRFPANPLTINPDQPIAQTNPDQLPPENVTWRPINPSASPDQDGPSGPRAAASSRSRPAAAPMNSSGDIMVTREHTRAEASPQIPAPEGSVRQLKGVLIQRPPTQRSPYTLQLQDQDGRFIAFVDLSGVYIAALDPFLGERVLLRGPLRALSANDQRLVLLASSLRLAQ
jgi:hypothetical protein